MRWILHILLFLLFFTTLHAEELKIKADYFESNQQKGISVFKGGVHITKGYDEINASKVTIFTDARRNPVKFVAEGNVHFKLEDKERKRYAGQAQKVVYEPSKKVYRFYRNVHLHQIGDAKEIHGDEVVFNAVSGESHAKGAKDNPVIMIFNIEEKKEEK